MQRLFFNLGHRIPNRHIDRTDRNRALTMATGLLIAHHGFPDLVGAKDASSVKQCVRFCLQRAWNEPLTHQCTLTIAPIRIEAITNNRLAVADDVGHDGDQTQRHLGKIDVRVTDIGFDGTC